MLDLSSNAFFVNHTGPVRRPIITLLCNTGQGANDHEMLTKSSTVKYEIVNIS
jgi:hypothetical protein